MVPPPARAVKPQNAKESSIENLTSKFTNVSISATARANIASTSLKKPVIATKSTKGIENTPKLTNGEVSPGALAMRTCNEGLQKLGTLANGEVKSM